MDFLSEATMDMVHPPDVAESSPLQAAFASAFPSNKIRSGDQFIQSGTKKIRGQAASAVLGIIQNVDHGRWQDIKRAVETKISRFSEFEQEEMRKGSLPFINTNNPIIDTSNGNMTLTWYRPKTSSSGAWDVPKSARMQNNLKQAG